MPDRSGKIKKTSSTDYAKVAKALGDIMSAGIKISLVNINKSDFGFKPDVESNQILFGLKAMLNVSDESVKTIIANRPYASIKDFVNKVNLNKQTMISLIKGGAFDTLMDRKSCMVWYLWETCDKKKKITLQNMSSLIKYDLLPNDTEEHILAKRVYEFNRYLKAMCLNKNSQVYMLDARAITFLHEIDCESIIEINNSGIEYCSIKDWEKIYQNWMNVFRVWINEDKDIILNNLNEKIFKEDWDKYAAGNLSSWEMETLCFYYNEHELAHIDNYKYGFVDFFKLPTEPVVEKSFQKGDKEIKIFKLYKICGTVIAKNKTKSTVSLLTTSGVVNVKFRKEYFNLFDKQISEKGEDGKKHVVEKSWFNRGNMIVVQGIRSGDDFITKKYNSSNGHQLYKITSVNGANINLISNRYKGESEE